MVSFDTVAFATWCSITAVFIAVTSLVYKRIARRRSDGAHPP